MDALTKPGLEARWDSIETTESRFELRRTMAELLVQLASQTIDVSDWQARIEAAVKSGNTALGTIQTAAAASNSSLANIQIGVGTSNNTLTTIHTAVGISSHTLAAIHKTAETGNTRLQDIHTAVGIGNRTLTTIHAASDAGNIKLHEIHGELGNGNRLLADISKALHTLNDNFSVIDRRLAEACAELRQITHDLKSEKGERVPEPARPIPPKR